MLKASRSQELSIGSENPILPIWKLDRRLQFLIAKIGAFYSKSRGTMQNCSSVCNYVTYWSREQIWQWVFWIVVSCNGITWAGVCCCWYISVCSPKWCFSLVIGFYFSWLPCCCCFLGFFFFFFNIYNVSSHCSFSQCHDTCSHSWICCRKHT